MVARFLVVKMAIYRRYLFEIAPLFAGAIGLENMCLPEGFVKVLKWQYVQPVYLWPK